MSVNYTFVAFLRLTELSPLRNLVKSLLFYLRGDIIGIMEAM